MNQWQIGDIKVTRVVEMEVAGGTKFILPDATREACQTYEWMEPHFMDAQGNLIMSVHALVVDTGDKRIAAMLVDWARRVNARRWRGMASWLEVGALVTARCPRCHQRAYFSAIPPWPD